MKNHLPIEWYVARLNYLDEQIKELPRMKKGMHRGVEIIRYYDNGWHQISSAREKMYNEYLAKYRKRKALKEEFSILMKEWRQLFNASYYSLRDDYAIKTNTDSLLTNLFWDKLIDNQCSVENKTALYFDNHNFRSRAEQRIAEAAKELHLIYKYDCGVKLNGGSVYPDFTFAFPEFNRCTFLEYYGMLADENYRLKVVNKNTLYLKNKIYDNRDLFMICGDADYMPNGDAIKTILISMVTLLCHLYVSKRTNINQ